jgi:DNA replicative helicase MCM subunit Mcm2 (Cdc46/Mcm family)
VAQILPQDMLRKYIQYAKEKVHPKLHNLDEDKLSRQVVFFFRREQKVVRANNRDHTVCMASFGGSR